MKNQTEVCIYCDQEVPSIDESFDQVPTDLDGWLERAEHHAPGCDWVNTHAHTLAGEGVSHWDGWAVRTDKEALQREIDAR